MLPSICDVLRRVKLDEHSTYCIYELRVCQGVVREFFERLADERPTQQRAERRPRNALDCAGGAPVATFLLERTCVFPAFGTYTVTGTAVTANGWTTSATTTVTVPVPVPAPEVVDIFFALVHSSPTENVVSFSVRSVNDATRYHWTFDGDGRGHYDLLPRPVHIHATITGTDCHRTSDRRRRPHACYRLCQRHLVTVNERAQFDGRPFTVMSA